MAKDVARGTLWFHLMLMCFYEMNVIPALHEAQCVRLPSPRTYPVNYFLGLKEITRA
jgi:hypothetical protein